MVRDDIKVENEWHFDALDLRPVERWLAALPTVPFESEDQRTITTLAQPPLRFIDSYLDTDDWRMARAGFVVRTRRHGHQDEITLKTTKQAVKGGVRAPLEVTEELYESRVTALGHDGPVGRRVHAVAGRQPLRPILQVRTRRRPFTVRIDGVDAARIALDDTVIVVGNGQRPMQLRRVEVEAFPAWTPMMARLVRQLRAACGLQPAALSKFEAGLLARDLEIPGPPDLGPTDIGPEATLGELAYAVVRRQLAVLRDKEPGTRLGEDPEELHEMRVATRRLRAALDLFVDVLPIRVRHFRGELGWFAGVLGAVRDLDVQLEGQAAMIEPGQQELWAELTALLVRERDIARVELLTALDSVRWQRLMSGMSALAQQGPFGRPTVTRTIALMAVPDLIGCRHAAVVKAAKRAKRSGKAGDFHRLRIRCKRLRYSLEFSAELYGGRTNRYTRQLAKLQDQLGLFQDAEVAANRLYELATGNAHLPASTIFVMGGVAEQHRRETARLLDQLPAEVSRVRGREWQDLAATMEQERDALLALVPPAHGNLRVLATPPLPVDVIAVDQPPLSVSTFMLQEAPRLAGGGESPA